MTVVEKRKDHVALNLTTGEIHALDDVRINLFTTPLFISDIFIVYEVVFWSNPWQMWIYLVTDHTVRLFPPESRSREVTVGELAWYETEAKRLGLAR